MEAPDFSLCDRECGPHTCRLKDSINAFAEEKAQLFEGEPLPPSLVRQADYFYAHCRKARSLIDFHVELEALPETTEA